MIEDFNFDSIQIKIPQRSENSHKGDFGKVLVLGGCKGMGGAAILSSEASLFCGSGLVHLHTHSTNVEASLKRNPEVMTLGIDNDYEIFDGIDVVLCGPGLKDDEWSYGVYKQAITINDKHALILDAGALRYLSKSYKDFQVTNRSLILTPHPGEASMLLNVSIDEIQEDRSGAAKEISNKYNADVILKGNKTIVCSKIDNRISLCNEGGPELATGGTGDILAGVISAMVAQKLTPHDSCILSIALHARAGKSFNENVGEIGLNASALIPLIRNLLNK